ncbi:MAG: ABC transporter substrate-binding protein [Planctomycetota bacterium]|jgi:ribose transport system substrate-binding protein
MPCRALQPFVLIILWTFVALALHGCGGGEPAPVAGGGGGNDAAPALARIAVIPKGTTHVFWKSVERGARAAGQRLNVEIIWKGPLKENDRAQQIQVVENFIGQGVDGIVLAPLDRRALVRPVQEAATRGIPVVIFDSALDGEPGTDFVSFVATDNRAGGAMGGAHLAGLLDGAGKVVLLRYQVGSASTDNRERGFLDAIGEHPDVTVTVDNQYAGATAGEAKSQALNMLDRIREADGIFCPNESSTYGMLLALRQEGLAGQVRFVGFDASPPLLEALRAGEIDALVVQNPEGMGARAVEALVAHRRGKPVETTIDTGAVLVTRDNMNEPEIGALIQ